MGIIKNWKNKRARKRNIRTLHQTPHTRDLDLKVGVGGEYQVGCTLGVCEWECVGEMMLYQAAQHGHFVAFPLDPSPYGRDSSYECRRLWYESCHGYGRDYHQGQVPFMLERDLLVKETLESGIEVVSPSYRVVYAMYKYYRDMGARVAEFESVDDCLKWIERF